MASAPLVLGESAYSAEERCEGVENVDLSASKLSGCGQPANNPPLLVWVDGTLSEPRERFSAKQRVRTVTTSQARSATPWICCRSGVPCGYCSDPLASLENARARL